jgi:DNA (cytosine-5)-methyltransferase 1
MKSVELFAGAGGLAMGAELAGFSPLAVIERDRWAYSTLLDNKNSGYPLVADWPIHRCDVRDFDWTTIPEGIELVAGGPPCQPFSLGGKHGAFNDDRDMFPVTVDVIRRLRPMAFMIENVRGLTREAFANYYQYILLQLEFPEVQRKNRENWYEHLMRLQTERSALGKIPNGLTYNVVPTLVNAADYGIPQKRDRVFIVGFRSDLEIEWSFPRATHSFDELILSQWVRMDYWDRHEIARKRRPGPPNGLASRIKHLMARETRAGDQPWRTVRDALQALPDPEASTRVKINDHTFQPGARAYPGHTGSSLDQPAKALKAGDHGVPGGENMMVKDSGEVRYFTLRESARLQTFPDGFRFRGTWTENMRQLGNAVPMMLAQRVASSVAERLAASNIYGLQRVLETDPRQKQWAS